jgi:hypothetical protein
MDGVVEEAALRTSPIPAFQQVSGGEATSARYRGPWNPRVHDGTAICRRMECLPADEESPEAALNDARLFHAHSLVMIGPRSLSPPRVSGASVSRAVAHDWAPLD